MRQKEQTLRPNIKLATLAILVGVIGGLGAVVFRYFIILVNNLGFHSTFSLDFVSPISHHLSWLVILLPALGGLIVGLITHYFAPETKGHGVPEVMKAVAVDDGRIRPRVALAKILASGVCLGSGGSAGREGPIVQIGSSAGSAIGQWLHLHTEELKILVGCGAAAGIAATFNAPIAGVVFAFEVILLEFKTRSFVPLVVSSTFATITARHFLGPNPTFGVLSYELASPWEMGLYPLLGIIAALVGILEIKSLYKVEDFFAALKIHPVAKPVIGGLMLGAIGLWVPQVFGVGYETITNGLNGGLPWVGIQLFGFFLLLIVIKIVAFSLTLGSGGSGGVFAPSLFIGAAVGGGFGIIANNLFPWTAPYPAYALVGMVAVFAAASRAPLTSIIILFEMTRDYHIILPLMFTVVVADVLAWVLHPHTIYTEKLERQGIMMSMDMEINKFKTKRVEHVMSREVETVLESTTLVKVRNKILRSGHQSFPVIDENGDLVGIITGRDVAKGIKDKKRRVAEVVSKNLIAVYPDETLDAALKKLREKKIGRVPVVSRENPKKLVGFITRSDLFS